MTINNMSMYLIVVSVISVLTLGYLSYNFYGQKIEAERALQSALATNMTLTNSLAKKDQECRINEELISEWSKEKDTLDEQKDSDIQKIDKLPDKKQSEVKPDEDGDVVNIDGKLPIELKRLLDETFNRVSN